MKIGGLFSALRTTMSGMSNQMQRLDVISENIANAEKVPDENGNVYQKKIVIPARNSRSAQSKFSNVLDLKMRRTRSEHISSKNSEGRMSSNRRSGDLKVVTESGFKLEYNPGHPRADENGYVKMPKINAVEEMVDLLAASRTYEANVTVLNAAKAMAKKALEI